MRNALKALAWLVALLVAAAALGTVYHVFQIH
jgi:hypothetical protein